MKRQIVVLGSTGSIGVNTLDVIAGQPEQFEVLALGAYRSVERMIEQCTAFQPRYAVMTDPKAAQDLARRLRQAGERTEVLEAPDALNTLAAHEDADVVVGGIVGAVGLPSILAAVQAGKSVLIANKEPLVMMGPEIMAMAHQSGATILPLDSEHNAIFQCLPTTQNGACKVHTEGVRRLLLTGSGGPFRTRDASEFSRVTPEEACAHPNWEMGRKISVDSATMMNKGLELIEACALFDLPESKIEIVVHPQSTVHSMVEYLDGSILAQLGSPDMRVPIAHALGWPQRLDTGVTPLDLLAQGRLDFEAPDLDKFPALSLAREVVRTNGTAPATFNAANEVAVEAFLTGAIRFDRIPSLIAETLDAADVCAERSLERVLEADQRARDIAVQRVGQSASVSLVSGAGATTRSSANQGV